jgi:glycosyltransferase involved in cell wall biosynthesis
MISVVCVSKDSKILDEYLLRSLKNQSSPYEFIGIDNTDGKYESAASALNDGAKRVTGDYIMFAHNDVSFLSSDWLEQVEILLRSIPDLGVAGVAGAVGKLRYHKVISNIAHGEPPRPTGEIVITYPTSVQTVDECLFIVPRKVYEKNHFDETICTGWHLFATDLCLTCGEQGLVNYVLPVIMYHRSDGRSMSPDFYDTISRLCLKHRGRYRRIVTTCTTWNVWIALIYRIYWPIMPILHRHLPKLSRVEGRLAQRLR